MFQSLLCQGIFPRVLHLLVARIADFKSYSVSFVDRVDGKQCLVRTWAEDSCLEVCVDVQPLGQSVPQAELGSLSRVLGSIPGGQLPLSIEGASPSLLRVLSDNRDDGHQFILSRHFSEEVFISCYRQAHQEVLGMMEVTSMLDYLMLRLRGALQEPWLEDTLVLRRCIVAGRVSFCDLREAAAELIPVWKSVREFVRYTGPRHIKTETDMVSRIAIVFVFPISFTRFEFDWVWLVVPNKRGEFGARKGGEKSCFIVVVWCVLDARHRQSGVL